MNVGAEFYFFAFCVAWSVESKDDAPRRAAKVRGASLPEEYRLSRMLQNVKNPLRSWSESKPACSWECVHCSGEAITRFDCQEKRLKGEVRWEELPNTLTFFSVFKNELEGTLYLSNLPLDLNILNGSYNKFEGEIDLCHLPENMHELLFSENLLSGFVNFSHLPPNLITLALRDNSGLFGEMVLDELPKKLSYRPITNTGIKIT